MIDLDADTLTLRRRPMIVDQYDGHPPAFAVVQGSPVVSRRPRGDESIAVLMYVAMKTPETFRVTPGFKVCTNCNIEQPFHNYSPDRRMKSGLSSQCKECRAAQTDRWRKTQAA